ncbi:MAG: plastocyanin/azurin family copper-binding protein [Gaiellaceae bacterium]
MNNVISIKGEPMLRILGVGAAVAVVALSLLLAGTASAAPKTVVGKVGPGFTISLKLDGKKVTKLKAGIAYRFAVTDQSSAHDFHLTGPGVNKVITGVGFTGTKSVVLKLKKGAYRFVCDPHAAFMKGSFKVS